MLLMMGDKLILLCKRKTYCMNMSIYMDQGMGLVEYSASVWQFVVLVQFCYSLGCLVIKHFLLSIRCLDSLT